MSAANPQRQPSRPGSTRLRGRRSASPRRSQGPKRDLVNFLSPWVPIWVDLENLSGPQLIKIAFQTFCSLLEEDLPVAAEFALQLRRGYADQPESLFSWASLHLVGKRDALALRIFEQLSRECPRHTLGHLAVQSALDIRQANPQFDDEQWQRKAAYEECDYFWQKGEVAQARELAEAAQQLWPCDANLQLMSAQCAHLLGQSETAIQICESLLQERAHHPSASALLWQIQFLTGQLEQPWKNQADWADWQRAAECAAFWGHDEECVDCLRRATREGQRTAWLCHFAAVAEARCGRWGAAKRLWEEALVLAPDLDVARQNLLNARTPRPVRCSAWPFPLSRWVGLRWLEDLPELGQFPAHLVAPLLDRGDPTAVELAAQVAMLGHREEFVPVIESALEKSRANEKLRQKLQNWLDTEPVPQAQEFSVGRSPSSALPEDLRKILEEVDLAMLAGHFGKAEDQLIKALRKQPEQPHLRHLLARCYALTQRPAAALSLWRKIQAEDPTFLPAALSLAQDYLQRSPSSKSFAQVRALVEPVLKRSYYEVSEFAQLCDTQLRLAHLERDALSFELWAKLWRDLEEEFPEASRFRSHLLKDN